jgi:ABC-type bacteriocin/lantibiotic exporter with double-glycine peptidase domain
VADRTVRARQANAAVTTFAQEGLTGLRVLKASGRGAAHAARLRGLANAQADAELAAARLQAALAPVYTLLVTGGVLAVVWLGGHRVISGALSIGDLVALLALFGRFTGRAFRIPQMANRVQAAAAAYGRLAPLLAPPPPLEQEHPRPAGTPIGSPACPTARNPRSHVRRGRRRRPRSA